MLEEQLRDAWQSQARDVPIQSIPHFTPRGLVLGAGTILVSADGNRRLKTLKGQEARILALLSSAYGRAVSPAVLGNIERAAMSWREGMMVDAKGPGYAGLINFPKGLESITKEFLDQALREVQAAGDRPIRWYFAEAAAAEFARPLFRDDTEGRSKIEIVVLPRSKKKQ